MAWPAPTSDDLRYVNATIVLPKPAARPCSPLPAAIAATKDSIVDLIGEFYRFQGAAQGEAEFNAKQAIKRYFSSGNPAWSVC